MTAHALIMIFFVVVPIFFGGFANFLLPYHVGSKDVAFPRLNSIGFWIQPCGYLLIAKIGFIRQQYWHYYDKSSFYFPMIDLNKYDKYIYTENSGKNYKKINENIFVPYRKYKDYNSDEDRMLFIFNSDPLVAKWEERNSIINKYSVKRIKEIKDKNGPELKKILQWLWIRKLVCNKTYKIYCSINQKFIQI